MIKLNSHGFDKIIIEIPRCIQKPKKNEIIFTKTCFFSVNTRSGNVILCMWVFQLRLITSVILVTSSELLRYHCNKRPLGFDRRGAYLFIGYFFCLI